MTGRIRLTFSKCSIKHMFHPSHCFWNEFSTIRCVRMWSHMSNFNRFFSPRFGVSWTRQSKTKHFRSFTNKRFDNPQLESWMSLALTLSHRAEPWDWINWHYFKPSTQPPGPDTADPPFKWRYHDKSQQLAFSFVISRSHHRREERKTLLTMSQDSARQLFRVIQCYSIETLFSFINTFQIKRNEQLIDKFFHGLIFLGWLNVILVWPSIIASFKPKNGRKKLKNKLLLLAVTGVTVVFVHKQLRFHSRRKGFFTKIVRFFLLLNIFELRPDYEWRHSRSRRQGSRTVVSKRPTTAFMDRHQSRRTVKCLKLSH